MQFRLRTLLIVLAVGPPVLAGAWLHRNWPNQQVWTTHFTAALCFVLLYPVAFLTVIAAARRQKWPPMPQRITSLDIFGFALVLLVIVAAAVYMMSLPTDQRP